jgi:hypothetical protein
MSREDTARAATTPLVHLCKGRVPCTVRYRKAAQVTRASRPATGGTALDQNPSTYTPEQAERLALIHDRLVEARRELDALIGDAYLRPRASVVPVHFLDLAAAVEKLRWAEKEWRELDKEVAERSDLRIIEYDSAST